MSIVKTTENAQDLAYELIDRHNEEVLNSFEDKSLAYKNYYFISVGKLQRMFTLWSFNEIRIFKQDNYIKNLSTDIVKAVEVAIELAKRVNRRIDIDRDTVYEKRDLERFETGKHAGELIKEVAVNDPGYIAFIGGKIEEDLAAKRIQYNYLSKRQHLILDYKAEAVAILIDRAMEKFRGTDYVGKVGEKLVVNVKLHKVNSFTGFYGLTYFHTFLTEANETIIYKGSVDLRGDQYQVKKCSITGMELKSNDKFFDTLYHVGINEGRFHTWFHGYAEGSRDIQEKLRSMDLSSIEYANYVGKDMKIYNFQPVSDGEYKYENEIGEMFKLSGTIKEHSDYKGVKQTIVQRVKLEKI